MESRVNSFMIPSPTILLRVYVGRIVWKFRITDAGLRELAVGQLAGQPDIAHYIARFREAEVRLGHTNAIGKIFPEFLAWMNARSQNPKAFN
jgi:hypothetical protein